jgi:hypothetical protein
MPVPMEIARLLADEVDADVMIYNGPMARHHVFEFVQRAYFYRARPNFILVLVTDGGDPDAAYKMMRYLQLRYKRITVIVAGSCKSAGTLAALGAHELAFAPYGELGPLDIQQYKTDNLAGMESGLTISEAIDTLTRKALDYHREHYTGILNSSGGVISFGSAAKVASDLVTGIFSPIFDRIDPYDVGQKARSMRIANDYGERLMRVGGNLKQNALDTLTRGYPSHSFVVDMEEAKELFNNVRVLSDREVELVDSLGPPARMQISHEAIIYFLSEPEAEIERDAGAADGPAHEDADGDRREAAGLGADAGGEEAVPLGRAEND